MPGIPGMPSMRRTPAIPNMPSASRTAPRRAPTTTSRRVVTVYTLNNTSDGTVEMLPESARNIVIVACAGGGGGAGGYREGGNGGNAGGVQIDDKVPVLDSGAVYRLYMEIGAGGLFGSSAASGGAGQSTKITLEDASNPGQYRTLMAEGGSGGKVVGMGVAGTHPGWNGADPDARLAAYLSPGDVGRGGRGGQPTGSFAGQSATGNGGAGGGGGASAYKDDNSIQAGKGGAGAPGCVIVAYDL